MPSDTIPRYDQIITFIYVQDLEESSQFYGATLGLPLSLDQGSCRIYQVSSDGYLGLCQCKDAIASPQDNVILTFVTQDVNERYETLLKKGVTFEKPPTCNPQFKIYHCFFRDPDGYLLEIQRFEDPLWNAAEKKPEDDSTQQ